MFNTESSGRLPRSAKGLLALAFLLASAPAWGAPVGFVTSLEGLAQVQVANGTTWQPAALDGSVSVGDSVRTERNSRVKILLVDDTILTVGEDSELYIDRMIVGDLATQERSILREMRGQVRAQVGRAFGGTTRLEIHTPTAIVGVRGSTMNVKVRRRRSGRWETIAAIESGNGFACSRRAGKRKPSDCLDINAGLASTILQGGVPSAPGPIPADFDAGLDAGITEVAIAEPDVDGQLGFGEPGVAALDSGLADATDTGVLQQDVLNVTNQTTQDVGIAESTDVFDGDVFEGDPETSPPLAPDPPPPPPPPVEPTLPTLPPVIVGPELPGGGPVIVGPGLPGLPGLPGPVVIQE